MAKVAGLANVAGDKVDRPGLYFVLQIPAFFVRLPVKKVSENPLRP